MTCDKCGAPMQIGEWPFCYSAASVARLLFMRGPAAVLRLIVAVVVDSIERVSLRWSRSHVVHEHGEVFPRRTDADATGTVSVIEAVEHVGASGVHGSPRCVGEGFSNGASGVAVPSVARSGNLPTEAPATGGRPTFQFVARNDCRGSATTATDVSGSFSASVWDRAVASYHGKATEHLSVVEWL